MCAGLHHAEFREFHCYAHNFLNQGSPRLPGTVNWGTATVIGVFAGMLYGGSKEAAASVVSL